MIVVTIIGILAAIAIPKFASLIRKSQEGETIGNLGALRSAATIFYAENEGNWPSQLTDLTVRGKYLSALPKARIPNYHPDTSQASVGSLTGAGSGGCTCDEAMWHDYVVSLGIDPTNNTCAEDGMTDWCADRSQADCSAGMAGVACVWGAGGSGVTDTGGWGWDQAGAVYVNCTHTDSKGVTWTRY